MITRLAGVGKLAADWGRSSVLMASEIPTLKYFFILYTFQIEPASNCGFRSLNRQFGAKLDNGPNRVKRV